MNIMTNVQEGVYQRLKQFDAHMKKSVTEPYGQKKLSDREQLDMFRSMTPDQMIDTMRTKGYVETSRWINEMEQKEAKYGR